MTAKTAGIEILKTVGGFVAGRGLAVAGKKALKVNEELDPKKKKMKELAVGGGVAAVGVAVAIKAPNQFKSIGAGIASAGAISMMSPFGKDDAGFIPVLHGHNGVSALGTIDGEYYDADASELNALSQEEQDLERELMEADELVENSAINGMSDDYDTVDVDHTELSSEMN